MDNFKNYLIFYREVLGLVFPELTELVTAGYILCLQTRSAMPRHALNVLLKMERLVCRSTERPVLSLNYGW